MTKTSKMIAVVLVIAVLIIGVGYAAIQNITLNIAGSAAADPNQANFNVKFSGVPEVSSETCVTASVTDDTNATINVSGLTAKGDKVTATYTIQNASASLSANITNIVITNSNEEYFEVSEELTTTTLGRGEATTITVTVQLIKTPITDSVSSTIGVQFEAKPVQS